MPVEMKMWRLDAGVPRPLQSALLPTEAELEDYLVTDPSLLGTPLLVIGRQVRTPFNKLIDLLAIDGDGNLHVLELKRDKTPRDVVAQVLDYGSWVSTLAREDVIDIAGEHLQEPLEVAFSKNFGDTFPDEVNTELELTIVATSLDSSTERIVTYLRGLGVPVNAVFFAYLEDEDRRYLARSWLVEDQAAAAPVGVKKGKRAQWNGRDWYVNFGSHGREWSDGRKYGFVSAGGGPAFSGRVRAIPSGDRVNVYVPGRGYVGVGTVLGEARPFLTASVRHGDEWVALADQPLLGSYQHAPEGEDETDDIADWVVPVEWLATAPLEEAFMEQGMFSNPNAACKLRQEFTLERLAAHFDVGSDDD